MCPRLKPTAIDTEGAWSLQMASCTDTLHHLSQRRPGLSRQREWHQTKGKTLTEFLVPNAQRDGRRHCLQNIAKSTRRKTSDAIMNAHWVRITTIEPGYPEKTRQRSSRRFRRKKTLNHQGLQVNEMKTMNETPQSQKITQKATVVNILLASFSFNNSGTNQWVNARAAWKRKYARSNLHWFQIELISDCPDLWRACDQRDMQSNSHSDQFWKWKYASFNLHWFQIDLISDCPDLRQAYDQRDLHSIGHSDQFSPSFALLTYHVWNIAPSRTLLEVHLKHNRSRTTPDWSSNVPSYANQCPASEENQW